MNLIGETPVVTAQFIIERNQTPFLPVEERETATVWMHPKETVHVLKNVESRTRTFGITVFNQNLFTGDYSCCRVEMSHDTRFFLFKPDFRRTVYVGRKNRTVGQRFASQRRIMYGSFRLQMIGKETIRVRCDHRLLRSYFVNGGDAALRRQFKQCKVATFFPIRPDASMIGSETDVSVILLRRIKSLVHATVLSFCLRKVGNRFPRARTNQAQSVIRQQPIVSRFILIDFKNMERREQFRLAGVNIPCQAVIFFGMGQDTDRSVIVGQQPDSPVRHYFNGMYIERTSLFSRSGHLLESLRSGIEAMDTVVVCQQPEETITIFIHMVYPVIGQTDVISLTCLIGLESVAVKTVDTIPSSKPQIVFMVLKDVHDCVLRQSVLCRIVGKEAMLLCMCREYDSQQ